MFEKMRVVNQSHKFSKIPGKDLPPDLNKQLLNFHTQSVRLSQSTPNKSIFQTTLNEKNTSNMQSSGQSFLNRQTSNLKYNQKPNLSQKD